MNENKQQAPKKRVRLARFVQPITVGGMTASTMSTNKKDSGPKAEDMELVPAGVLIRYAGRDGAKFVVLVPLANVTSAELEGE